MMTGSPLQQIVAGMGFTSAVMSSSATTLMVVTSVNNSLLTLSQGLGVILGANLASTFIVWFIAFFAFTVKLTSFCYPVFLLGFVLTMFKKYPRLKIYGSILMAFAMLFIAINFIGSSLTSLNDHLAINTSLTTLSNYGIGSVLVFFLIGILVAAMIASSSATIILTLIMLSFGWLTYDLACAIVLGANVGTTIPTIIAALKGNYMAKRAAFSRNIFNIVGAILALVFFFPFVRLSGAIASMFSGENPATGTPLPIVAVYGVCIFHTLFYFIDTLIFVGLREKIAGLSSKLIKEEAAPLDGHIKYISSTVLRTPSISIVQAMKEVTNFGEICYDGFKYFSKLLHEKDPDKFEEYRMKLVDYESVTDKMEYSIADFLGKISTRDLNDKETTEIKAIYRIIGEMESLGDCGENFSRVLSRERIHNREFDLETVGKIDMMLRKLDSAYNVMNFNLKASLAGNLDNIENAILAEEEINRTRNRLRDEAIDNIEKKNPNYQSVNYFLDLLSDLEAMGDFIINISQSLIRIEDKEA